MSHFPLLVSVSKGDLYEGGGRDRGPDSYCCLVHYDEGAIEVSELH